MAAFYSEIGLLRPIASPPFFFYGLIHPTRSSSFLFLLLLLFLLGMYLSRSDRSVADTLQKEDQITERNR